MCTFSVLYFEEGIMIRLSKLTDYGFVILTRFVKEGVGRVNNARDVAADVHLPLPTVSKLLKTLARNGLLTAHRGVKGGYSLARAPEEITVADIITALEGPVSMTDCINDEQVTRSCMLELFCPMRLKWKGVNDIIVEALQKMSLAEMVAQVPEGALLADEAEHERAVPSKRLQKPNRSQTAHHAEGDHTSDETKDRPRGVEAPQRGAAKD
ncbi:SUF system Fe-S cluster assembly regulator [candidate division BRC1 bacterium HGW-BRC1-1]|nr:MAG: SUF system Fe-S cluster assembly regulator [candidate division BRC1 bacterium HGW-BRC1-1]